MGRPRPKPERRINVSYTRKVSAALLIGVTICTTPVALLVETARDRVETVVETVVFYCRDRRDR